MVLINIVLYRLKRNNLTMRKESDIINGEIESDKYGIYTEFMA